MLAAAGIKVFLIASPRNTQGATLVVQDYTHSTAPNRRFADLATQRLVKAVIAKASTPYSDAELDAIASDYTEHENLARKVERETNKRIAQQGIGETLKAIVNRLRNRPVSQDARSKGCSQISDRRACKKPAFP